MAGRPLRDRLVRRARKAGASLDSALASSFENYLALLARWNAKINLTAFDLADPNDEAIDRLPLAPLVPAQHRAQPPPPRAATLIDIGSGRGSPAIPLRLAAPGTALTMVEVKTRKAVF